MFWSRDLNGMFKVLKDYNPMTPIDYPHVWHDTELGQSDTFGSSVMMGSQQTIWIEILYVVY